MHRPAGERIRLKRAVRGPRSLYVGCLPPNDSMFSTFPCFRRCPGAGY
jgi:hypothetical protein